MRISIRLALAITGVALAGAAIIFFMPKSRSPFESVCNDHNPRYSADLCAKIGMRAHPLDSVSPVVQGDYGEIVGVAWRNKDNIISRPGDVKRFSEKNDYYYIVCTSDSPDSCSLQLNADVEAR
ncbi:MAG: hypothetical protein ABW189_05450 [Rickettsiales bacterium]